MKKLMLALGVLSVSFSVLAAQCEGKTQAGERCKRDAAEGKHYCIGHADQAPKSQATEKDDGTCWAVTAEGTRCKHKKVEDKDYCTQHAADVKPAKPEDQCRAMTYIGTRCTRKPLEGSRYCPQHAGKSAAPKAEK